MARICVDPDDFDVDAGGVLHIADKIGSEQLLPFITPGTFSFDPALFPGLKAVRVVCVGGGGGGAGANASAGECIVRAGGSGGGYSESVFTLAQLGAGVKGITVGAGGVGATGNDPGTNGGASSFGGSLVIAPGGNGSVASQSSGTGAGGVTGTGGPVCGTGQVCMGGGVGGGAIRLDSNSGLTGGGGASGNGMGTGGGQRASEGGAYGLRGYGGGGGGAFSIGGNETGGDGGDGAVFLYLQF